MLFKFLISNTVTLLFDVGSKFCLWSTITLFTFSISEQILDLVTVRFPARQDIKQDGVEIRKEFERKQKEKAYFPRYIYYYAFTSLLWFANLILSNVSLSTFSQCGWICETYVYFYLTLALGIGTIVLTFLVTKGGFESDWARQ